MQGRYLDLTGQKFGTRTVLSRGTDFPSKGTRWFVRCECGDEKLVGTQELRLARECSKCTYRKCPDLVGKRFGKRVVLGLAVRGNTNHRRWCVRCDCGSEFTCLERDLRRNGPCRKCSPGLKAPRPNKRKRPFEAQYNAWIGHARYVVSITYEQFLEFTKIPDCHYCGAPVHWMKHGLKGSKKTTASNLDRKDSTKPYEIGNVVVCCRRCNIGKNTLFSYEEWKEIGEVIRSWRNREIPYFCGHNSRRENDWRRDLPKDKPFAYQRKPIVMGAIN